MPIVVRGDYRDAKKKKKVVARNRDVRDETFTRLTRKAKSPDGITRTLPYRI